MARPRKYLDDESRAAAGRLKRRKWYHRNRATESAKSLRTYHTNRGGTLDKHNAQTHQLPAPACRASTAHPPHACLTAVDSCQTTMPRQTPAVHRTSACHSTNRTASLSESTSPEPRGATNDRLPDHGGVPNIHLPDNGGASNLHFTLDAPREPVQSDSLDQRVGTNRGRVRAMQNLCADTQGALARWTAGNNLTHDAAVARRILDSWTGGAFREWGHNLYVMCIGCHSEPSFLSGLADFASIAHILESRVDSICRRSFALDPSGLAGEWRVAQMLRRDVAKVIDMVEEFLLILRDGGTSSLVESFNEFSLNFQSL